MKTTYLIALALGISSIAFATGAAAKDKGENGVQHLAERIAVIKDHDELERFHYIYGYQQDYMLYYAQADLNARDVEHHYKYGVYTGPDAPRRLWPGRWGGFTGFADMPIYGALIDHHQVQPVISISEDRLSARARFRTSTDRFFTQVGSGLQNPTHAAEGAEHSVWYENQYIREDDMWKLRSVNVCIYAEAALGSGFSDLPVPGRFGVPADAGEDYWKTRARTSTEVGNWNLLKDVAKNGPDRVETPEEYGCFFAKNQTMVHSVVLPFHFPNPVTGQMVTWENK